MRASGAMESWLRPCSSSRGVLFSWTFLQARRPGWRIRRLSSARLGSKLGLSMRSAIVPSTLLLGLSFAIAGAAAADPDPFAKVVLPFISKHCLDCHKADKKKGDLVLDGYKTGPNSVKDRNWYSIQIG